MSLSLKIENKSELSLSEIALNAMLYVCSRYSTIQAAYEYLSSVEKPEKQTFFVYRGGTHIAIHEVDTDGDIKQPRAAIITA